MTMTSTELKRFFSKMEKDCGIKYINKDIIGGITGTLLRLIRKKYAGFLTDLMDKLRPFCAKNIVVLDFNIGDDTDWMRQVEVAVHEAQHSYDIREFVSSFKSKFGKVAKWYKNYFTSQVFRAHAEGRPNTAQAEVRYYLTGRYDAPVCQYDQYLITDQAARALFESGCEKRRRLIVGEGPGASTQPAARHAINILKDMGF